MPEKSALSSKRPKKITVDQSKVLKNRLFEFFLEQPGIRDFILEFCDLKAYTAFCQIVNEQIIFKIWGELPDNYPTRKIPHRVDISPDEWCY